MVKLIPIITAGVCQEQLILTAIFRHLVDDGKVRVVNQFHDDAALASAWTFLLLNPDRPVSVVLETWSEEPERIREVYDENRRRIEINVPSSPDRWHLALAIPDLRAWALVDDHIREEYEKIHQDPETTSDPEEQQRIERSNLRALAARIGDWTADRPFDLDKLKAKSRQARELCTFIEESWKPKPVPVTTADWF